MNNLLRSPEKLFVVLIVFLPACGGNNLCSVAGDATYDGQLISEGRIEFLPADGKGSGSGGLIVDGSYEVNGMTSGLKIVQIIAVKTVPWRRSFKAKAKMAEAARRKGDFTGLVDPADIIPADAEGNSVTVEVKVGRQKLDFDLKKPVKRKAE